MSTVVAELSIRCKHTVQAIGYSKHYGQLKLDTGQKYQPGENVEHQKEQLTESCKIIITKIRDNNSTKRRFAICKIVQEGEWAGVLEYKKVPLYRRKSLKILDVKSVQHKGKKRKLLLAEDGTVYKVKSSKLEDIVKAWQFV